MANTTIELGKGVPIAITAEGLAKSFPGVAAVNGIDLQVKPGELMALLGPSGSGKTTLLRLFGGLETPTAGRILFGDEDATHLPVRERRVGFMSQHYALFKHMTVAENVAYGLSVRARRLRPSSTEIRKRAEDLLELVQLPGLGKRYPAQLSGGPRQRVALARALAVEPRVLLLDEPFGALDAQVRRDLRRWLRELHDRTGHTTLFVTHDQEEALELADRVAILNRGRLEQLGVPDDILDHPATPFVAGFVGDAVRLSVNVEAGWISLGGGKVPAPFQFPTGPAALFVRPSDLTLAHSTGHGTFSSKVVGTRRVGSARRAELVLDENLRSIEVTLPLEHAVHKGEELHLNLFIMQLFPAR